jgi:hypothetical protein
MQKDSARLYITVIVVAEKGSNVRCVADTAHNRSQRFPSRTSLRKSA